MRCLFLGVFALLVFSVSAARADILFYQLPGTSLAVMLQGEVTVHQGGNTTLRHSRFGNLHFPLKQIRFKDVPTTGTIAVRMRQEAVRENDLEACLNAGRWALHHGLLPEFYEAAFAAWELDRNHPAVKRLADLKRKIDQRVPVASAQEAEMRKYVPLGSKMSFVRSKHFLLMHDTPTKREKISKKTRAEQRLELLETVLESFMLKFCLEGLELEIPKEHLKVVLFSQKEDYLGFGEMLKPDLSKASGFYDKMANTSVFFDQGTNEIYDLLDTLNRELQGVKDALIKSRSPAAGDIARLANTLQLLTEVSKENADIEVVSHEGTHQLAANTGLMPNEAAVPLWAAEGLATYFESPTDAAWSGIGAVNEERLDWYRALERDRTHSNVDFIVSDKIFLQAAGTEATLHAYGQAWALTHFLMDQHFDKLVKYYDAIAKISIDDDLSFERNVETFEQVFGAPASQLDLEWRSYMRSLKTDVEQVLAGK